MRLKPDVLDLGCFDQSCCDQHGEHLFTLVQVAAVDPKFAKAEALGPQTLPNPAKRSCCC